MLYTEEIKGFPTQKVVELRCEFFGLAGHYALRLKPSEANPNAPTTSAYIKVSILVFFVYVRNTQLVQNSLRLHILPLYYSNFTRKLEIKTDSDFTVCTFANFLFPYLALNQTRILYFKTSCKVVSTLVFI